MKKLAIFFLISTETIQFVWETRLRTLVLTLVHWQVSHRVTRIELDTPDQVTWADGGDSKPSYRKVTKIEVWGGNSHNSYTKLTPELDVQVCHYYLSLHKNKWPQTKTVYWTLGIINALRDALYLGRVLKLGLKIEYSFFNGSQEPPSTWYRAHRTIPSTFGSSKCLSFRSQSTKIQLQ